MSDTDTVTPPQEATRLVGTGWDEDGNDTAQSVLTGTNLKVRALALTTPDLVVPILFVPGIMGSRLKVKGTSAPAWFPPEGKLAGVGLLFRNLAASAADRQRILDPNNTEVDDNGPAHPDESSKALLAIAEGATDAERAKWRGWGQVYGASYGGILSLLEKAMALVFDPLSRGTQLSTTWSTLVMGQQDAAKLGAQKPFTPLQESQLRDASDVLYPVHAVGYNWLQSNKRSGERLAQEIERITAHYRNKGKTCEKVVIVTHSMGGLVARSCAQMPGIADRILGIVHGVMPAIGAPATYKRFRAGWEGAEQIILGRNAADCTAVMANAPGPLELLPSAQYKTKSTEGTRHWLRASYRGMNSEGQAQNQDVLLGDGDPYADIYLNDSLDWWKLVKEDLIDPAGRQARKKAKKEGKEIVGEDLDNRDFKKFQTNMDTAYMLHEIIKDKYHATTYAYYAADPKQLAWNEVHWKCDKSVTGDLTAASLVHDNYNGTVKLSFTVKPESKAAPNPMPAQEPVPNGAALPPTNVILINGTIDHPAETTSGLFEIQGPRGPGDGTVPEESGAAPTPFVVQIFRHEGKAKGHESYDHQNSYGAKLAQSVTLYSLIKIVADSDWLKQNLQK